MAKSTGGTVLGSAGQGGVSFDQKTINDQTSVSIDSNGTVTIDNVSGLNEGNAPPKTPPLIQSSINDGGPISWIDIRVTEIADSQNPGSVATLDSFFREVTGGELKGRTDAVWKGDEEGEFDFKYDSEGGKFGAGTAFLKDD